MLFLAVGNLGSISRTVDTEGDLNGWKRGVSHQQQKKKKKIAWAIEGLRTHLETCAAGSSSELRSISKISSLCPVLAEQALAAAAALAEGSETGGVSSSLRGSPLCFFLRLFFFFVASVLGGSGGSSGSAASSSAFAVLCSTSEIQNRWLSVGIGEVARWAGTSCCGAKREHTEGASPTRPKAARTDQTQQDLSKHLV